MTSEFYLIAEALLLVGLAYGVFLEGRAAVKSALERRAFQKTSEK